MISQVTTYRLLLLVVMMIFSFTRGNSQCSNYTITVGGGTWDSEITWDLIDENGTTQATGFAPFSGIYCLNPGCFTINMYDSFGDGWNGANFIITDNGGNIVFVNTVSIGTFATADVALGGGICAGPPPCAFETYTLAVAGGIWESEITWEFLNAGGTILSSGTAPNTISICLEDGCYTINMYDSFGDGWNGATWTLTDSFGSIMGTGTLGTGSFGESAISVNGIDCLPDVITASDCHDAVDVCSDTEFMIDPNGFGSVMEIPPVGSVSNPSYDALNPSPWGGGNTGCLLSQELNSTWMIINISQGGILEFTFGGLGTQSGFYDWAMWPFDDNTCLAIFTSTIAPVRCNWNGAAFGGTGCCVTLPVGGDASNFEPAMNVTTGDQYLVCFSNWSSITNNVPLEFYGTAVVSCEPILLPIELMSFEAMNLGHEVLLEWVTASEVDNAYFTIERSVDLDKWVIIDEIAGAGTSFEEIQYQLIDKDPISGTSYYRLKQTDFSGYSMHSKTISINLDFPEELKVWPNPSQGKFNVSLQGIHLNKNNMAIVNVMGEQEDFSLMMTSSNINEIQLNSFIPGVYYIMVSNQMGEIVLSEKLIVE